MARLDRRVPTLGALLRRMGSITRSARDLRASPLHAPDHAGLRPALVQVAEHDPLRDDGTRYARRLREAGVAVRFTEYLGAPHGYVSFPGVCGVAPQTLAEIVNELRERLGPDVPITRQESV